MIANILGLGWAATPAGLKAMEEMQKLNPDKKTATKSMCMFMIINMSSLQLVTMNIVAYRLQYGSNNPSEIIGPGILATLVSSAAAVMFAKLWERGA
jgi:spore maturation protein A